MTTPSALQVVSYLDSPEMAAARRRELDLPRHVASALGRSAVEAVREGFYVTREGHRVDWRESVLRAREAKESIPPEAILPKVVGEPVSLTRIHIANETTLAAARRLVAGGGRPLALNFANGIEPGGGFLSGARAQEEVLCRSSALYATLEGDPMYTAHARRELPDSTDWAIHSPDVPVFRHDDGVELPEPWLLSILTCAAPYAPTVGQPKSRELLRQRIDRVLAIARSHGYRELVLGAWGCGAFANDPRDTAQDFRDAIETTFAGAFETIVFAITDWSPERRFIGPFGDLFGADSKPDQEQA